MCSLENGNPLFRFKVGAMEFMEALHKKHLLTDFNMMIAMFIVEALAIALDSTEGYLQSITRKPLSIMFPVK